MCVTRDEKSVSKTVKEISKINLRIDIFFQKKKKKITKEGQHEKKSYVPAPNFLIICSSCVFDSDSTMLEIQMR